MYGQSPGRQSKASRLQGRCAAPNRVAKQEALLVQALESVPVPVMLHVQVQVQVQGQVLVLQMVEGLLRILAAAGYSPDAGGRNLLVLDDHILLEVDAHILLEVDGYIL